MNEQLGLGTSPVDWGLDTTLNQASSLSHTKTDHDAGARTRTG